MPRMIAGLELPTEGDIYFDDVCVYSTEKGINVSPYKRNVGFLFQNYALWPHMTVRQNISFGLENMKWVKSKIEARVKEICETMRAELKRLHMTTGATFVYVTHDQSEAMTLSSKVCLMKLGVLQQYCPPLQLYGEPHNLFCADFMGNPTMNFIDCTGKVTGDGVELL